MQSDMMMGYRAENPGGGPGNTVKSKKQLAQLRKYEYKSKHEVKLGNYCHKRLLREYHD